jgi:YD repeat-containing protein
MNLKFFAIVTAFLSLTLSPAASADDYIPPKVLTMTPTGVNLSDGSFVFTDTDLQMGPLKLERFHQGGLKDPNTMFFGPRISHNFDIYVKANFNGAMKGGVPGSRYKPIVHIGHSSVGVYIYGLPAGSTPTILPANQDGWSGKLEKVSGTFIFTDPDGTIYTFGGPVAAGAYESQRVTTIAFADGRTQAFSYNGGGQLKEVADSSGYALIFDYNGSGQVSAACIFNLSETYVSPTSTCSGAARKTSYSYTGGFLTGVTDVSGQLTTYAWSSDISCVTPPGYSTCKVANTYSAGAPWNVASQTLADGSVWHYALTDGRASRTPDPNMQPLDPTDGGSVTDSGGKTSYYSFANGAPWGATDANGNTTLYVFKGGYQDEWSLYSLIPPDRQEGTLLMEATLPEGGKYLAEYFGPYNTLSKQTFRAKPGSGLPDAVISYAFISCSWPTLTPTCNKPISKTDPKGNVINYTYAGFGGIASEMQPAPSAGAARPLKLYTYVQMSAYVKNSGGTLVSTGVPIWLISTMTQCQTVAGSGTVACDTASTAPRLQTSYQYPSGATANNLLVRGIEVKDLITGNKRLTCFTYDDVGRKISETSARGTSSISVCP